jgi:lipopolysaccharide/colanic/teichoic acid biosynthesis glycosyltransferase
MKRAFDIIASGLALLLLSPLLLPLAVVLRCTGEGEIFYRQQRVGRGKKLFHIYKFATMLKNSPNLGGGDITVAGDPRILPMGRFLRNTKINELPQLLNILIGDMSIIGWRPLTPRVADLFPKAHWEALEDWRPGLSGIGSIVFRDEEALLSGVADRISVYASAIVPYKSALEVWYTKHQSFRLDMKLIAITAVAMMKPGYDFSRNLPDLPQVTAALTALREHARSRA